jgi:phosphomannomutase
VLVHRLEQGRVVVRPSGTEPKLKAYLELVDPAGGALDELAAAVEARLGLGSVGA